MDSVVDKAIPVDWSLVDDSREAFETFVKTHMKKAYFLALGLVGNHEDALELSQEAFARAYQHRHTLNAKGKFFPWFYQILRNLCISHLRKQVHRRALAMEQPDGTPLDLPDDGFSPDALAEQNETQTRLWKAIGQLEPKHREVIMLRHFQNLSYEDMARMLFCNKGTVTSRLYYARQRLRDLLEQEKGGQPE